MGVLCKLGFHAWDGCKCTACEITQCGQHHDSLVMLTNEIPSYASQYTRLCFLIQDEEYGPLFQGLPETREWWDLKVLRDIPNVAYNNPTEAWQNIYEMESL